MLPEKNDTGDDALAVEAGHSGFPRRMVGVSVIFAFLAYCLVFLELAAFFLPGMKLSDSLGATFALAVMLSYPFFYILPLLLVNGVGILALIPAKISDRAKTFTLGTVLVATLSFIQLFLYADYKIYKMFHFHFNGFVWNLLTTPGGAESMGAGNDIAIYIAILAITLIGFNAFLFCLSLKGGTGRFGRLQPAFRKKWLALVIWLSVVTLCGAYERTVFAITYYKGETEILDDSLNIPFYMPTRMSHIAKRLRVKRVKKRDDDVLDQGSSLGHYPLKTIVAPAEKRHDYNIVWLVSESWRADTVTPEIMPAAFDFAQKSWFFKNHYSAGNGTRMALFGMFYGLYGTYWIPALSGEIEPVIMKVLRQRGYQFDLRTSAKFTYPEFDKTIFSHIPKSRMHQSDGRGGFVNDRRNVSEMLDFMRNRDPRRPFMVFMFFESPHAPYTFPKECVIRKDYLPHINYATVDVKKEIHRIKNRYINAVHHLDTQLERIFTFLKEQDLLKNTIVVITGDHGEEFLEAGHWGHNAGFHQEEIKPPLIIHFPHGGSKTYEGISSHLDLPATVAHLLGVETPSYAYSFGIDLLSDQRRTYTVCSDWEHICYIDSKYKYVIPTQYSILDTNKLFTLRDKPVSDKADFFKTRGKIIRDLLSNAERFK